jgi:hypothetical protein
MPVLPLRAVVSSWLGRLVAPEVARRVQLAVRALDDARDALVSGQRRLERDRYVYDREDVLRQALEAWRVNPLARRIVSLTSQYVVGAGMSVSSQHPAAHDFLQAWWGHRLNRMAVRVAEWCDELTRSGNLIVLVSTDASGMSYVRALPASQVEDILTAGNDVEQPVTIVEKLQWGQAAPRAWPAYDEASDRLAADGTFPTVALHYAINRPVAAVWGESDLAPLLKWLSRYSAWLEDRARLNRFRQSFMYVVRGAFANKADRLARQAELNANPPNPGSILVTDAQTETWSVLHPQLDSFAAGEDGLALKKMISAGSGNPLHFLAEPESATRTTAESAGGPTFRHYEQRQNFFAWLIGDVARVVVNRRALVDPALRHTAGAEGNEAAISPLGPFRPRIAVTCADISARDNAALALAASQIAAAFSALRDRQAIDDAELLRMVYRFAGEIADVEALIEAGRRAGPPLGAGQTGPARAEHKPGLGVDTGAAEARQQTPDA